MDLRIRRRCGTAFLASSYRLRAFALACAIALALPWSTHAWDASRMRTAAAQAGPKAAAAVGDLQALIAAVADAPEAAALVAVNEFFNRRILFRDDMSVWGVVDHWASPLELLAQGAGDCEDYAIAKFFALLAGGVPVARLRLVYVRVAVGGPGGAQQAHMVLAYYADANREPLILDNLVNEVRPASRRPDLTPVFSFNSEGLWQGTGRVAEGDAQARLSRWREVVAKARAEGFL